MGDIYRSINRVTKTNVHTKAYHQPRYKSIPEVTTKGISEVSYNKGKKPYLYDKSHNSSNFRKPYNGSPHNRYPSNSHSYQAPMKVKCYCCDAEHQIDECKKFKKTRTCTTSVETSIELAEQLIGGMQLSNHWL